MNNWYVIQVKPCRENDVHLRLQKANIESLNPKIKSFSSGMRPLFPNYVFVRWDLTKAHNYQLIKYTRGVNRILGTPEYPIPLPDEAIEVIKERLNAGVLEAQTMKVGSTVKIRRGLLKDLIGVLEKPVSADGRVAVLLRIHEQQMKAMMYCKDVALVA